MANASTLDLLTDAIDELSKLALATFERDDLREFDFDLEEIADNLNRSGHETPAAFGELLAKAREARN